MRTPKLSDYDGPQGDEEFEARAQRQSAALQEIFRRADQRTKYGRSIGITEDVRLLIQIRELAREALL